MKTSPFSWILAVKKRASRGLSNGAGPKIKK
jgi:hypothetical protein